MYNQFSTQKTLSYIFLGTSVAVWAYDLYHVHQKSARLKSSITKGKSQYYYNLSTRIYKETSITQRLNTKTNFDYALERADSYYDSYRLEDALSAYNEASLLEPENQYVKVRVEIIIKTLENTRITNEKYNQSIRTGDSLFVIKEYENAKISYQTALSLKPFEKYPESKISEINLILKNNSIDKQYFSEISAADSLYKAGGYLQAKQYYETARNIKPDETYPKSRLLDIDNKLKEQDYTQQILNGDQAVKSKNYELAIGYFEKALLIKPDEFYPKKQISFCEKEIEESKLIEIPLVKEGNVFILKVKLNDLMNFDFILDTGADNVLISQDIFSTFWKAGIITKSDILNYTEFSIADGSSVIGLKFILKKIQFGDIILTNVEASVIDGNNTQCLLGGSAFKQLGKIAIDYTESKLLIHP